MIHISLLVDHIKARLGVSHRQIELSDEAIISCLTQETLNTLSIYCPYYCFLGLKLKGREVMPNMNTYFIPRELGDDFNVVGVEYILPSTNGFDGNGSDMFYMPAGGDLQGILSSFAANMASISITSKLTMPMIPEFQPPNMVRINASYASRQNATFVVRTTHRKDFATFPFGLLEVIKELSFYDVCLDIYHIRKYFSNVQTLFAQIQLDTDFLSSIPDKRADLIERLRKNQQKFSNTKKIYTV